MASEPVRASSDWLALREPADAAARSLELVADLRWLVAARSALVIHDLGCGTGSMARWLAPQLAGPQHWVLHDRDAELLDHAAAHAPPRTADGADVRVETRLADITRLDPDELKGADVVTASALLDMMSEAELDRFVRSCAGAGCPVLVTLSVVGRVELLPPHQLDAEIGDAFNAHQRRTTRAATLLGPDAAGRAVDRFTELGLDVTVHPSPWRLGPDQSVLAAEWLAGWVAAATEQRPALVGSAAPYLRLRLDQAATGTLSVTVHHEDLLAR
jgi:hypothetical protein